MAKPPHICIQFRVMMIKASFIPKSDSGRIKRYRINFSWLAKHAIWGCPPTAEKIFPESRI
jgi:hypothetical protein